jgi:type II secretory pathway component PulC
MAIMTQHQHQQQHHQQQHHDIPSHSTHSSTSAASSSFGSLACISVRNDDPSAGAAITGIELEQDSNGQVTVTNIAANGLFGNTPLEIGDVVLAVNKKRLSKGDGPEVWMKMIHNLATICIAVKKPGNAGALLGSRRKSARRNSKSKRNNISSSSRSNFSSSTDFSNSSHHHKPPRNNNSFKLDTYYGGMAQHNADGSLAFQKVGAPSVENEPTQTLTISAFKAEAANASSGSNGNPQRRSFGSTLRSQSKSPHANRKRLDGKSKNKSKSTHHKKNNSNGISKECVGLKLGIGDTKQLVIEAIQARSIFRNTKLRVGDHVLSINDMSFRKFADADYATTIMDKAHLMVTLVVERSMDDDGDNTDNEAGEHDDEDSIYSFGNYNDDDEYDADESEAFSTNSFANNSNCNNNNSNSNININNSIETEFKIEKYRPVTISVPKSRKSEDAGLVFKMVRTNKPAALHTNNKETTWIYVHKIEPDSMFRKTSLRKGDKIVCINNVNLREDPDPRAAHQACCDSNESIAMVVLKDDESIYKEKMFALD